MNNLARYSVSFRICDDNLDPLEITQILGVKPNVSHRKGDRNVSWSKKGKPIELSPHSSGIWIIHSEAGEYVGLEHHLRSLLVVLCPLKDELLELYIKGYKMDMFCGVFVSEVHQPGFDIASDVLLKLGELKIELSVCIYR